MRDGENEKVIRVGDAVIERIRESPETNAVKPNSEDRPPIGLSRHAFDGSVNFRSEIESKPFPTPFVPSPSISVLLRGQPMEADLHA